MRATGIVRRIDDLGRIVVPKEIRKIMKIREGDPIEIYTEGEGEIVLKKYSHIGEIESFATEYAKSMGQYTNNTVVITDRSKIVAVSGRGLDKKNIGKSISKELENIIEGRVLVKDENKSLRISSEEVNKVGKIIKPVICEGDVIGSVIMLAEKSDTKLTETDEHIILVAADFLGKQIEG